MKNRLFRILSAIIAAVTLIGVGVTVPEASRIGVSASSAVLIEADHGRIIYEKNAHVRRGMASTTKIMTALVAIEAGDLDRRIKIPAEAVDVEGSSLYLTLGEELTLRELLYALMLRSANDAAIAIAISVGGTLQGFSDMMNDRAEKMGLENTHFENPHGLDGEEHYTTAYDLARITCEALKNPVFREISSTVTKTLPLNGNEGRRLVVNHNRLLRTYEGCIGVKTGFTKKCGRCLVTAAERDGVTLISVTLNAPDDWNDHTRMLDHGFSLYERTTLNAEDVKGKVSVVGGVSDAVNYSVEGSAEATVERGGSVRRVIEISRFYYAPVKEGEVLGRAVFYDGDTEIASFPVVAIETVEAKKVSFSLIRWLKELFHKIF